MNDTIDFRVESLASPTRLDKVIRDQFPGWGRQEVSKMIQNRQVKVNGQTVWMGSWKIKPGDRIEIRNPVVGRPRVWEEFDRSWLVEDAGELMVVCKPAGLLSQATRGAGKHDLLSLAQKKFGKELRLFHRLDRETSGLCLLTRPGPVNAYLDKAFKQRKVVKEYRAWVSSRGDLRSEGQIRVYLAQHDQKFDMMQVVERGGQFSLTDYMLEGKVGEGWQVWLRPHTGRTHQLRVQLAFMGAPILGDRLYGGRSAERLMLHAERIALPAEGIFPAREWSIEPGFKPRG